MSTEIETEEVMALINGYAEVLNSGNAKAIGGFYTTDGAIFPNGRNSVYKKQLDVISGEFFKKNSFKIDYQVQNVTVGGDYAFVESVATTRSSAPNSQPLNKITRDLFILRRDLETWKIYRYLFNNFK